MMKNINKFVLIAIAIVAILLVVNFAKGEVSFVPRISDRHAQNVSMNSAVLAGTLESIGDDVETQVWFEWGENGSFDRKSQELTLSTRGREFFTTLENLQANTKYNFRVAAENEAGIVYSQVGTFTTKSSDVLGASTARNEFKITSWSRNVSVGEQTLKQISYGQPGDVFQVRVDVKNISNRTQRNVVFAINPLQIGKLVNLITINGTTYSVNAAKALNIGDIKEGQTITIVYEIVLNNANYFNAGTNEAITLIAADNDLSYNKLMVSNGVVLGAYTQVSKVSTGLADKLSAMSIVIPLLIALGLILVFRKQLKALIANLSLKK